MIQGRGGWGRTPPWLEDPIRGLAFWLGWRHVRYPHYPLAEGAISGELIALVHGSLSREISLMPEVGYSEIAFGGFGRRRADLVVGELRRDAAGEMRPVPDRVHAVVEVKRAAAWCRIEEDLHRLLRFLHGSHAPAPRAFLIVAYQAGRPDAQFIRRDPGSGAYSAASKQLRLVTKDGLVGEARVRRVVRASSVRRESDEGVTSTHHVCLVEVSARVAGGPGRAEGSPVQKERDRTGV